MSKTVSIIDSNKTFTPLVFYNDFLNKIAVFYKENQNEEIVFKLFEKGDDEIYSSNYRIDPIAIPLLLSIIEQLSKFHVKPLNLLLYNNNATIAVMEFLFRSNFFKTSGQKSYYNFSGNNILNFKEEYLGAFKGREIRKDHIIRSYKKSDYSDIDFSRHTTKDEIELRDTINSLTAYSVQEHFTELLFDNENTLKNHNTYIDILSELITNGVLHSGSTTYAMMFVDTLKTKFSISDNGVGFKGSLMSKNDLPFYYKKEDFRNSISRTNSSFNVQYIENLLDIFETLFYSSLKERKGLFDLMLNVVLNSNGYFRLHTENCQIIVSNRLFKYVNNLQDLREEILTIHNQFELGKSTTENHKIKILEGKEKIKNEFNKLYNNIVKYYSEEIQFSSVRFFNVKFRGVHIEVEIPNN